MSDFDCPYCGKEHEADYDEVVSARFSRRCQSCSKLFDVDVEHQAVFYSYEPLDKKEES